MHRLFQFLFKYRTIITLILLEGICFWIIVNSNSYHGAKYFTSANHMVASIAATSDNVGDYFDLASQNKRLAEENAFLRQNLLDVSDSSYLERILLDSNQIGIKAKVIDNSLFFRNNYLTINKGKKDGIVTGMGVVGPNGIVGQVLHTTDNYSSVISLLHGKSMISAHHKPTGTLCTVVWKGSGPLHANLEYLPRHIKIIPGDSIITSGYSSIYPEDYLIGIVNDVQMGNEATFYDVEIELSTNFYNLSHVYLLDLTGQEEKDSLDLKIARQYE